MASAQLTARVRGKRVEVLSERGESSTTFANPDGSFTAENFMAPVRVRDKSGKDGWKDVDLTLVASSDGSVEPAQHPRKVKLAGTLAGAALTRLEDRQGREIEYRWLKRLPAPELSGNRATYRSVEPGVDLVQEVTRTSVEQFLILRNRAAALAAAAQAQDGVYRLRIPIKLKGLTPKQRQDGGLDFLDAKGTVTQTVPSPRAWDAEQIEEADVPANEIQPPMTFERSGANKGDLVLDVDATWLADPARQFPITIDPTTTLAAAHDTFVQSNISGAQAGSAELRVGTYDGSAKARSFMKFNTAPFRGSDVTSATLSLWNFHSWSCSARTMNIHSAAATDVNTTWANQPGGGSLRYSPSFAKGPSGCAAGWANIGVTGLAQLWADSSATVHGIRLSASESDVTGWKKFNSANASKNVPKLSVTYNRYPNTPGTATHTPGTSSASTSAPGWSTSATPTVKAVVSDPDGGSVKGLFNVYVYGNNTPIITKAVGSTVTSGGTSQYTIPAGKLTNGARYVIRAYASDGSLTSKVYGNYDNFVVDTIAPTTPTVASSTSPENGWSVNLDTNGKLAFTATSASTDLAKLQYSLDTATYATTVAAAANQNVAISVAKPAAGRHVLYVRSVDKAGNVSAGKAYAFFFGSGVALAQPVENHVTARRVPLQLQIDSTQVTALGAHSYQYRRGVTDAWKAVPLADVTTTSGAAVSTWPATAAPTTATSYWDAAKTLAGGGLIDVRAVFAGNGSATDPNTATVDINGGQSGDAEVGPGSVNLLTGEYSLNDTDATLFGASVGRSYGSRSLTAGEDNGQGGAFGPQWALAGSSEYVDSNWKSVRKTSGTSVELEGADGEVVAFTAANGGGWTSEPGAEDLKLTGTLTTSFTLTDSDGTVTTFAKPSVTPAPPADLWPVAAATPAGTGGSARYGYTTDSAGKLRLARIAAPNPALSDTVLQACAAAATDLLAAAQRGCRSLELVWAVPTGGFTGQRVTAVKSYAWDPAATSGSGAMIATIEATYTYDADGRLTGATDPKPGQTPGGQALTTAYTYNTSGLLTGLTPPGEQPWTFGYATGGTVTGPEWDRTLPTSKGRLVSASRPTLTPGTKDDVNGEATTNVVYGVPTTTSSGGPADLDTATTNQWAQPIAPVDGTAVFHTDAPGQAEDDHWAGDDTTSRSWGRSEVTYLDVNGRETNHLTRDGLLDATAYDRDGNPILQLDGGNRALAMNEGSDAEAALKELGLFDSSTDARAVNLATVTTYETGTSGAARPTLTQEPVRTVIAADGEQEQQRPTTRTSYDAGRPTTAAVSDLATSVTVGGYVVGANLATDPLDNARTTTTTYDWTLGLPLDVTTDPSPASGDEITTRTRYDTKGRITKQQQPSDAAGNGAGTRVTSYWDGGTGECGERPEWGDLVCTTSYAAAITGSSGNTSLPVVTTTYNRLGAARVVTESANGATRTTTTSFDAADRPVSVTFTSTNLGVALSTRTMAYDPATGTQTTLTADGKSITTTTDTLGRSLTYTDATGLRSSTRYDALDRATEVTETDTAPGGLSRTFTQSMIYAAGSGRLASQTDSQGGTIQVGYDTDGNVNRRTYTASTAGGLTATSRFDNTGAELERVWTMTALSEPVLSEATIENIHGQQVDHTQMPGGHRAYTYDNTGRLTATTDLDAGDCTTRSYKFDQNSNRTGRSTTTTAATTDSNGDAVVCPTATTPATDASYDSGDRITNTGYSYDSFGRTTRLPATGGQAIRVGYHVNDLVADQTLYATTADADADNGQGQNPLQASNYTLDPTGQRHATRSVRTTDTETGAASDVTRTLRYASSDDAPDWTDEGNGTITRAISGPGGDLAATATIAKTDPAADAVIWQITSIHGDVAATLPDTDTAPLQISRPDEYGASTGSNIDDAPRYGWLGAKQRPGDTPGGLILMGVRLYNPDTGRFLTTDPVYGGNPNTYTYPIDPINSYDLDGMWGFFKRLFKCRSCGRWLSGKVSFATRWWGKRISSAWGWATRTRIKLRDGNPYLRVGRSQGTGNFRVSFGNTHRHWKNTTGWRRQVTRVHGHFDRRYGGFDYHKNNNKSYNGKIYRR